ncbi:hypothetical protein J6590_006727 [Homalodisca vitripennis]|nr:hypothetical protein J6590_006727 [Homalodisca vitripennis]
MTLSSPVAVVSDNSAVQSGSEAGERRATADELCKRAHVLCKASVNVQPATPCDLHTSHCLEYLIGSWKIGDVNTEKCPGCGNSGRWISDDQCR